MLYFTHSFNKEKYSFLLSFHMVSEPWKVPVRVLPCSFFFGRREASILAKQGQDPGYTDCIQEKQKNYLPHKNLGKTTRYTLINLQVGPPPHSSGQPKR